MPPKAHGNCPMAVYFRGVAQLEACDVTNNGRHLGCHLGFYQELEIRLKPREMLLFVLSMKNNT